MNHVEHRPRSDAGFDRKLHTQAKCEICKFIMFYETKLGPLRAMRCPGCKGPVQRTDGRLFLNPRYTTPEAKPFRTTEAVSTPQARVSWRQRAMAGAPQIEVRQVSPGEIEYASAVGAKLDCWVPGCGGREVEYKNRNGVRVLYVFNPARAQHGWLNLDSDIVFSTSELTHAIGATV